MALGLSPNLPKQRIEPTIPQDVPVYRVIDERGFYCDDNLIPKGEYIIWEEEPNPMMQPMNELAHEAFCEYLKKLDAFGKEWADREKKSYVSQLKQYQNSLGIEEGEDLRRAKVIGGREETPIMGAKRKGPAKAQRVIVPSEVGTPMMGSFDKNTVNKNADKSKTIL